MTVTSWSAAPDTAWRASIPSRGTGIIALACASVGAMAGALPGLGRPLVAAFGLLTFVLVAVASRHLALRLVLVWLVMLGFTRRALIPFVGWSDLDPLLLVSPAAAVVLLIVQRGSEIRPRWAMSSCAAFMLLWGLAQLLNPLEPSIWVAAQSTIFYVTPLLWFFVGRRLDGAGHDAVLRVVLGANVVVVLHGLYQTFVGFLPFEYTWVGVSGFGEAIFFHGFRIRPFSVLGSPQEYGLFLAVSNAVIWSRLLYEPHPRRRRWLAAMLVVSIGAQFLQASRGPFVLMVLALLAMTVVRFRSVAIGAGAIAVIVGSVLWGTLTDSPPRPQASSPAPTGPVAVLAQHQVTGLRDPSRSTAPLHIHLIEEALVEAIRAPLGHGVSYKSIARYKQQGAGSTSAENDVAATAAALGLPFAIALVGFIALGLIGSVQLQLRQPSPRHLAWFGIAVAMLSQWMSGQLYAVSTVLWLVLGGIASEVPTLLKVGRRGS